MNRRFGQLKSLSAENKDHVSPQPSETPAGDLSKTVLIGPPLYLIRSAKLCSPHCEHIIKYKQHQNWNGNFYKRGGRNLFIRAMFKDMLSGQTSIHH